MDDELLDLIPALRPSRLLVVGDLMLDRSHMLGAADERCADSQADSTCESVMIQPGGAAYVATILSGFENMVTVAGVLGEDAEGETLRQSLLSSGVETCLSGDPGRPTTVKERFLMPRRETWQCVMRLDRELAAPLPANRESEFCEELASCISESDGVLISDYAKGVCSSRVIASVIDAAQRAGLPVVVDPSRRSSWDQYGGCNVLTPNRHEAETATGRTIRNVEDAVASGRQICNTTEAQACIVTLDSDGAVLTTRDGHTEHFPVGRRRVTDSTGAGDAFAASLLHATVSGLSPRDSVRWANFIAGLQVERFGTASLTFNDVHSVLVRERTAGTALKCISLSELERAVDDRRKSGERIVLTNGCFDLLHAGHVEYLEEAAGEGDCLIVAVNTDETVTRLKGTNRPVSSERDRSRLLAALECVDHVVIFEEPTPHEVIRRVQPDVLVKGGDYAIEDVEGRELVEDYGGTVKTLGLTPGISTTNLLQRLLGAPAATSHAG